jgi:hypothetical protein
MEGRARVPLAASPSCLLLLPRSVRRIVPPETHGSTQLPSRLTIAFDAQEVVDKMHGEVFSQAVPLLTRLTLDEIEALGGVEIREPGSDRVLWKWPRGRR